MAIETLLQKMDKFVMSKNLKFLVVGVPLVFSSLGTYFTIEYASKGELREATVAGICTILNAYYAKDNSVVYFRSAGKIEKLENADTITFKVLDDISQRMVNYDRMGNNDASDKNNYYYRGKKLDPR